MNLSIIMLAAGCAALALGLLHAFFGYKLARFLLPVCGLALFCGALYIFVYGRLSLDATGTWLFFGGTCLAGYIALFFLRRVAAFFTGLLGSALLLVMLTYAFALQSFPPLYPLCLTLCVLGGLLAAVYKKAGVVIFSALFGGCAAAFAGLYMFIEGVDTAGFVLLGNILAPFEVFLTVNAALITGTALALAVLGLVLQFKLTARVQLLEDRLGGGTSFRLRGRSNNIEI